jgi:hypothetical protein
LKRVALAVEQPLVVLHLQIGIEPLLEPAVKVDEMGVGVVKGVTGRVRETP